MNFARAFDRLQLACVLMAAYFIISFLHVAFSSLAYPFPLEWMEGQTIDVVQRVVEGKPLYVRPSIEYVPFIYTPLYFHVSAAVASLTGVDFLPARLVSVFSVMATGALIFCWALREGCGWKNSLIGTGMFYSTYILSGRWFDIARIDSFFVLLLMVACYLFFYWRSAWGGVAAGVMMCIAFFTKQFALPVAVLLFMAGFVVHRRQALAAALAFAVVTFVCVRLSDILSHGWFNFYVFILPAAHPVNPAAFINFWYKDIIPIAGAMAAALAGLWLKYRESPKDGWIYAAMFAAFFIVVYIARIHEYGFHNVVMPFHAMLGLVLCISLTSIYKIRGSAPAAMACCLTMFSMITLIYPPSSYIPTAEARERNERFLEYLAMQEGEVFLSDIQFIQTRVGKKSYAYGMPAVDVIRARVNKRFRADLDREFKEAIREKRFSVIVPGRTFLKRFPYRDEIYVKAAVLPYTEGYSTDSIQNRENRIYIPSEQETNK